MSEVNLDNWRWLREISGLDIDAIEHYLELAHKNEAMLVAIHNRNAFNVYLPVRNKKVPKDIK